MSQSTIYRHTLNFGGRTWTLWGGADGLCRLSFQHDTEQTAQAWLDRYAPGSSVADDKRPFEEWGAVRLLEDYFAGLHPDFRELPLDLRGTAFQRQVWTALGDIPYGAVITYAELAERIGRPKAMRAVGAANGRNPLPVFLPCHRVIGANGTLTGYAGGLRLKQELLELEGIAHVAAAGHERFAF
ncbi:methylated-DNA--[protein]-cysteine S-methyltransferase [Paenibacillus rhizophilus]|uniref:Methylated-DNA--protein-cysteine methyltransferase n=1 Tax=Paenibacillus rhizophilus TaxID=1850366 RepID=A0A3N9P6E4_9BACL|nr:methylated-DNA--[protein]-cysteine S-methyltransferase [Paenibacillus rhizophilus]RQW10887.1 methylated-DNA--[protein]-cysteine S-methyltransferase [Paenibacillus rhizophilus]